MLPCIAATCHHDLESVIPFVHEQTDYRPVQGYDTHLFRVILIVQTLVYSIEKDVDVLVFLHSLFMQTVKKADDILSLRISEYSLQVGIQGY